MKPEQARKTWYLAFTAFVVVLPLRSHGWEPNARDRNAAVGAGNLTGYFRDLTSWLDRQVPADGKGITPASMKVLFAKRAFMAALAERDFIAKAGDLGAFAKANPKNKQFVAWVLAQSEIMDEVLLARTPSAMFARIDDSHMIDSQVLEDWKEIIHADPTSREGLYARLAAACALRPPGTANQGAGRPEKQSSVMDRYRHYRMAHANQELFPSFDGLSVWELTHVVSAGASNADLAWGREMVNTFLPSAKQGENVVSTTSLVKNQGSQIPYSDMSCILAGGGKCGPRSSFGVFINQAWGIPSIGVGQPGHAAVCWRGTDGKWQVGYGRAWDVSKVADRFTMSGAEFLEMTDQRTSGMFAQIEHLRWIAALLEKPASTYLPPADRKYANPRAAAVMAVAGAMGSEVWQAPKPNQYKQPARPMPAAKAKVPLKAVPGVIHVEAADFFAQGTESVWGSPPQVPVWDSCDEGKQLGFHLNVPDSYVGFKITVPKAGLYELTARVSVVDWNQSLFFRTFGTMHTPVNATASAVFKEWVNDLGPRKVIDKDLGTRWAVNEGVAKAWLEIDLGEPRTISKVMIDERRWNRVAKFTVDYKVGEEWKTIFEGENIGVGFRKDFEPVTARYVRLNILDCRDNGGPTIWEFSVGSEYDGCGFINPKWSANGPDGNGLAGRWQMTEPREIRLARGEQTIWLAAPFQRGLALKSFELKPTGK